MLTDSKFLLVWVGDLQKVTAFCSCANQELFLTQGGRMANQTVMITGGPSRFHLMTSVFDIDTFRLLNFKFELADGRTGSADVFIDGATQGNKTVEEWHLNGYFMPQGVDTPMKNMIPTKFTYSSKLRRGMIFSVDCRTLVGHHPAPDLLDLITWES
jgi:hypothetical protein